MKRRVLHIQGPIGPRRDTAASQLRVIHNLELKRRKPPELLDAKTPGTILLIRHRALPTVFCF